MWHGRRAKPLYAMPFDWKSMARGDSGVGWGGVGSPRRRGRCPAGGCSSGRSPPRRRLRAHAKGDVSERREPLAEDERENSSRGTDTPERAKHEAGKTAVIVEDAVLHGLGEGDHGSGEQTGGRERGRRGALSRTKFTVHSASSKTPKMLSIFISISISLFPSFPPYLRPSLPFSLFLSLALSLSLLPLLQSGNSPSRTQFSMDSASS
jgi:hypothetical protein